jgi:hypothetical protein
MMTYRHLTNMGEWCDHTSRQAADRCDAEQGYVGLTRGRLGVHEVEMAAPRTQAEIDRALKALAAQCKR